VRDSCLAPDNVGYAKWMSTHTPKKQPHIPDDDAKSSKPTSPSVRSAVGDPGGETHQQAVGDGPVITTSQGMPIADGQNALRVGARGPVTLNDFQLREKIFHFDHERIPERVVHARGYGAHGFFENYDSAADITSADVLARPGERTPAFVRFSTVAGSAGSADLARDVRGFAVKLYTKQGNWDIVGNNMPVFFVQDAIKFPDLVHAVKPEPDRGFPQAASAHDNFWDFASLMPETTHMLLWVMSDRGLPRSFRFMEGFGVHTFRMISEQGNSSFVKFHWKPKQGVQSVLWREAVQINGADPDFHRRDLWDAISNGDFPEWELGVQVFDDAFADEWDFDVLDASKLIPEELVPVRPLGRLVLDRLVDNFFAETEQVAFCTQNIVPGIDFSNDPLLAGRNFSYLDTQLKRLGSPNFAQLPINAPKCPFGNFQQDGHMAFRNPVGRANYEPNSWSEESASIRESPERGLVSFSSEEAGELRRARPERFADHFSQARQFFLSQTQTERTHIISAFTFELSKVERPDIRERVISNLRNVDGDLAKQIAAGVGMDDLPATSKPARMPIHLASSPKLSILTNPPETFSGRKVGVLIGDGFDSDDLQTLRESLAEEGVSLEVVAPKILGARPSEGPVVRADKTLTGGPSVLFDAVVVLADLSAVLGTTDETDAMNWIRDAHDHCKIIGFNSAALSLITFAGLEPDDGYVAVGADTGQSFLDVCRSGRFWQRSDKYPNFQSDSL
jgi:catalase